MKRILVFFISAWMVVGESLPLLTVGAAISVVLAPSESQALPRDRAAGRQGARMARQTGRQVSRTRRRAVYGLPVGAAAYAYRGYSYYRVGPRFYYPYMHMGRTVYINIESNNGYPAPPPPVGSFDVDIY